MCITVKFKKFIGEVMLSKDEIRKHIRDCKKYLSDEDLSSSSLCVAEKILNLPVFSECRQVFVYIATNREIRTDRIIETALCLGKRVAAPKCFGKNMEFFYFNDMSELCPGAFGILEPTAEMPAFPDENTLMLVPGTAFDLCMNRIGYGGGYYDRYFEKYRAVKYCKLGLAHEFQIFDLLMVEKHDYKVDGVVSPDSTKFI